MDLIARELMQRAVSTVPPELPLLELEKRFVEEGFSGFPVTDGDQLLGVVSRTDVVRRLQLERDVAERTSDFYRDATGFHEVPADSLTQIADRVGEALEELTVADVMNHAIHAVPPDQPLRLVAELLVDRRIHRVLVTDHGRLLGVISGTDFVKAYARGKLAPRV